MELIHRVLYRSSGRASVSVKGASVGELRCGDYFGERALICCAPRQATVTATETLVCYTLGRAVFERLLLGTCGLSAEFEKEMAKRQHLTESASNSALFEKPEFEALKIKQLLGQGTFGRVHLVEHGQDVYSLKRLSKADVVEALELRNLLAEKELLFECASQFVLTLHATYQSNDELFMLAELCQGGELWQYLYETDVLERTSLGGVTEKAAQFYAACVTSALLYVHNKGVAYRDLKPENLLLDSKGYLTLIDFGFAKKLPYFRNSIEFHTTFTLCGTPEYMAPARPAPGTF